MRLEPSEIQSIKQSVFHYVPQEQCNIYLFGSRADFHKKGGDIDLLLVIKDSSSLTRHLIQNHKLEILVDIKSAIGDQKIDLVITEERELLIDPFLKEIIKTAIRL